MTRMAITNIAISGGALDVLPGILRLSTPDPDIPSIVFSKCQTRLATLYRRVYKKDTAYYESVSFV